MPRQPLPQPLLFVDLGRARIAAAAVVLGACSTPAPVDPGEQLFSDATLGTNGRSCATCHVPEDDFSLTPEHVEAVWAANPNDPLFAAIDADDPEAETLTFDHLRLGLVRVWLTLPDNMDLIDTEGAVITPSDRQIFVWRSVPSIADAALTAPYQLDGRVGGLDAQAQGAITGHAEGATASPADLERIAAFERTIFTSERARTTAEYLAGGGDPASAPDLEAMLDLTPAEERGRVIYGQVCASCHGGANLATVTNDEIRRLSYPELNADGTVRYVVPPPMTGPTPHYVERPGNQFINIATVVENYFVFIGATEHESFTRSVDFPHYRFRFYRDASRTETIADLPPSLPFPPPDPPASCGFPPDAMFLTGFDENCNPISGPNFSVQEFSTDPGRAAITGDPNDFEAFDIPTLRGIARTAPYWHNNISGTLEEVVDLYSDHLLNRYPSLTINDDPEIDPDGDIGLIETLSEAQKVDLLAFLRRL